MANGDRRPIAAVRRISAWVLGTVAVFITLFGAGSESWAIAALGVALLVLAVSVVVVSAVRGGARAWIEGTAHVVSASEPPASSIFGRCELQVVIDAPGLPAAAVKIIDPRVPVAKWPDQGATLPIMVAVDDPRHVRIQWDDVLTHAEAAAREEFGEPDLLVEDLDLADDVPPPSTSTVDAGAPVSATETVAVPVDDPEADPVATVPPAGATGPVPRPRKPSPRPYRRREPPGGTSSAPGPGAGAVT